MELERETVVCGHRQSCFACVVGHVVGRCTPHTPGVGIRTSRCGALSLSLSLSLCVCVCECVCKCVRVRPSRRSERLISSGGGT